MTINDQNLIWIDCEMTGLSPQNNRLIEIATIITDNDLNIIAEGPVLAIHQDDEHLATMDEWNTRQHNQSGLVERVRSSRLTVAQAEQQTLEFLQQYVPANTSPMCGNSICMDRRFLARYMPALEKFFHYRHLDVSTLKILANRWAPHIVSGFTKESPHLALADIKESIAELVYYRRTFLKDFS